MSTYQKKKIVLLTLPIKYIVEPIRCFGSINQFVIGLQ